MNTQENELNLFTEKINDLIECKFILSEIRLSALLKALVTMPVVVHTVQSVGETFDYAAEYKRAVVGVLTEDGKKIKFQLPKDRTKLFVFVFCLLTEFDSGKRSFNKFLSEYFYDADINESYAAFAEEVLKPFKRAGLGILRNIDPESLNQEPLKEGEKFFTAEPIYINSEIFDAMIQTLNKLYEHVNGEILGTQRETDDASEMILALKNAILLKNPKLIKLMWIGFHNTVSKLRITETPVKRMHALLESANLV